MHTEEAKTADEEGKQHHLTQQSWQQENGRYQIVR